MFDKSAVTALIPACNAGRTIRRAIHSVRDQVGAIIVVDDGSSDDTVVRIRSMEVPHLTLLRSAVNRGIGATRQQLIAACESEVAVWIDADDEFLPGRVERLMAFIEDGAEWVFDAAVLYDGESGQFIRELPIPAELTDDDGILWEFARNFIPSLGWPMVRTEAARSIGYDSSYRQAEDYDHLLRAILDRRDIRFCTEPGYHHYHYHSSASRNLERQTLFAEMALSRYAFSQVSSLLESSRLPPSSRIAIYAYYYNRLNAWEKLYRLTLNYRMGNAEMAFFNGVACYQLHRRGEAIESFEQSLTINTSAAALNNLGVCLLEEGEDERGVALIEQALAIVPNYSDARGNLTGQQSRITRFPLREAPIRDDYS